MLPADIDECLEYGTCPQACMNTKGSYHCDCAQGYRKVGTGNQCEAEGRTEKYKSRNFGHVYYPKSSLF